MGSKIDDILAAIDKEKKYIELEFAYLRKIKLLLEESNKKFLAIKDKKILESFEKSLRKRCKRLVRKAGRTEIRVERFQRKVIALLKELRSYLPSAYHYNLKDSDLDKITIYSKNLMKYVSRRTGKIPTIINAATFDKKSLLENISQVIDESISPLLAQLNATLQYLEKNRSAIDATIRQAETFTLDIDTVFIKNGLNLNKTIVVFDSSLIKDIVIEKSIQKKKVYDIKLSVQKVIIPEEVNKEMKHRNKEGHPLVPKDLRNYLKQVLKAKVENVKPTKKEKDNIIRIWRGTNKGKSSTQGEEKRFRSSGEMEALVSAMRKSPLPIAILANDNDAIGVVKALPKIQHKPHISAFSYAKGVLFRAA